MILFPAFIGGLGTGELLVIGLIALLIFGSRLPEVGRSLGRGLMEFKKGLSGIKDEVHDVDRETDRRLDEELERREARRITGHADQGVDRAAPENVSVKEPVSEDRREEPRHPLQEPPAN